MVRYGMLYHKSRAQAANVNMSAKWMEDTNIVEMSEYVHVYYSEIKLWKMQSVLITLRPIVVAYQITA